MIPNHDRNALVLVSRYLQQPSKVMNGVLTIGLPMTEVEIDLLTALFDGAEARERFLRLAGRWVALHQAQFRANCSPGVCLRLGKTREPAFVLVEQDPILTALCNGFEPIPAFFCPRIVDLYF